MTVSTAATLEKVTPRDPDGIFKVISIINDFYNNGIDEHLAVLALLCLIVADILLGVARAWAQHTFSSSKLRKGIVSHVTMFLAVFLTYPFFVYSGQVGFINSFIFAMIASYGASILKNLSILGVKLPYLDKFVERNIDHDKELFQLTDDDIGRQDKKER